MKQLVIAIDGPSGAGKGTVARAVAAQLGYRHVDSGAMYRAVGWKALRDGVPLDSDDGVAALAERSIIDVTPPLITIDGSDVTRAIRTPEIDRAAAAVARLPKVRAVLVERQRECGTQGAIVMEGRDIGTVVFPNADVKIYLVARRPGAAARGRSRAFRRADGGRRRGDAAQNARRDRPYAHGVPAVRSEGCRGHRYDRQERRRSCTGSDFSDPPLLAFFVIFGRGRIELPAVLVALDDFVARAQLFVVLVLHAERLSDVVDDVLIGRRIVASGRLFTREVRVLDVHVDVAAGHVGHAAMPCAVLLELGPAGARRRAAAIHVE